MDLKEQIKAARQDEIDYCGTDIFYFIDTYCHIEDQDSEELVIPFKLWKEQRETLKTISSNKKTVILKARQLGFTWLALCYSAHLLLCNTGRKVSVLSIGEDEAKELVRREAFIFRYMPELIQEKKYAPPGWTGPTFEQSAMKITIEFGVGKPESVLKGLTSSKSAGSSLTADLLIIDEWAKQQFAREIWTSSYPTINRPGGGQVIGISSIIRGTLFEEIYTDIDNGFAKVFVSCFADPRRDQKWYDDTKKTIKGDITQEYPRTAEEALKIVGGSYFPEVTIETHIITIEEYRKRKEIGSNKIRYVCLDYGLDMLSAHWVEVGTDGKGIIYREYDKKDQTIRQACDTILDLSEDETIHGFLAPPDLWSRSQESGKSRYNLFLEGGINLIKTSNDYESGCSAMKEKFSTAYGTPELMILEGSCPNLLNSLQKVQKDKLRPNVYAKQPHDLTHDLDSIRCYCVYWTSKAKSPKDKVRKKWPDDLLEDYDNADKEIKQMMIERYGRVVR